MVDGELLRQGEVEAGLDRKAPQMGGDVGARLDGVDRHRARLVVRSLERLRHPDREDRQIVQEEGVEMIRVVHDDEIGPHRLELPRHRREEARGLALRAFAFHQRWKERRVRHAQCTNDCGHQCPPG
jgi:hypothetical protein